MNSTQPRDVHDMSPVKTSSFARRTAGWLETRPEVVAAVAATVLWLLLPLLVGLKYRLLAQKGLIS